MKSMHMEGQLYSILQRNLSMQLYRVLPTYSCHVLLSSGHGVLLLFHDSNISETFDVKQLWASW